MSVDAGRRMDGESSAARLRVSAILIGVVVDKLVFLTVAAPLALVTGGISSAAFSAGALPVGIASTALGAFAAAGVARQRFFAHGQLVGVIAFLVSVARFAANAAWPPAHAAAVHPLWWESLAWSGALVSGAAGGFAAGRLLTVRTDPRSDARPRVWLAVLVVLAGVLAMAEQL